MIRNAGTLTASRTKCIPQENYGTYTTGVWVRVDPRDGPTGTKDVPSQALRIVYSQGVSVNGRNSSVGVADGPMPIGDGRPGIGPLSDGATSPLRTRIRGFNRGLSGRKTRRQAGRPMNAPGLRACAYKTASGRREWPNRDPLGEHAGVNLYRYLYNSPLDYFDPLGTDCCPAWALRWAGLAELLGGGPEDPVADIVAGSILVVGTAIWICDTKAWHHESPNPDKTKRRGEHKNRPDGKRDRDSKPKPPEKPPQPPPTPPFDGPPKDGGPPSPRPGR